MKKPWIGERGEGRVVRGEGRGVRGEGWGESEERKYEMNTVRIICEH